MISAKEFVIKYCEASGWTEREFYETQVPMPDATSPSGWAAVSNNPLSIKAHVDLYMPEPKQHIRSALEIGIDRYGDAMQKLADGGD